MRIGEAVAALGIVQEDGDIVIVRPSQKGMAHFTLAEVQDKELTSDTYLATGTFGSGTITRAGGRSAGNLIRINELPFDFDLSDFTGIPKDELWTMPDSALWPLIEAQREAVDFAFRSIGLTLHRIDYTGYGLAGYLKLPLHKPDAIPAIQALHVRIVERINAIARLKLCDPQVKDAGTRIMRLPGCLNTKGPIHRLSRTLVQVDGLVTEAQLTVAAGATSSAPARIVPVSGALLDAATTEQLIAAVSPHWQLGQKHHLALALSGLLAKAGVPEEQTLSIIGQLSAFDDKPWDREKCVHRSYERVRSGDAVKGFYGLRETLPGELLDWLDGIAQRVRQASTPILTAHGGAVVRHAEPEAPRARRKEFDEVPASVLTGWVGEYCRLMTPTTEAPVAFHVGVGLTMIGSLLGRHLHSQYGTDPLYANLYTLLVGRSGRTRKDTAIKRATRVLFDNTPNSSKILMHGIGIATDVGSSTKLIDLLSKHPNTLLYLTEFTRLMGNARRQSTDTIIPTLMEAFDTPTIMQNNSMANPIEAVYPYLSIIAATQPDILSDTMSGSDMNSGFANRWLFVCGNLGEPNPLPPVLDRAVVGALLHELWESKHDYEPGAFLRMSPAAIERWNDWYIADFHKESPSAEEDSMRARHAVLIQKVALIYAVTDRSRHIELKHLDIGIELIEWMWAQIKRLTPTWGRSVDGQIEERIKNVLADGPLKRREIQQRSNSRKWSSVEFSKVFDAMVKNQLIVVDALGLAGLSND